MRGAIVPVVALLLGTGALSGGVMPVATAQAATSKQAKITDCTNDAQLRADATAGGSFVFACSGTITLTKAITVRHDLALGGGGNSVTIDGGGYHGRRIFDVDGATVSLSRLTLQDGVAWADNAADGRDGQPGTNGANGTFGGYGCTSCDGGPGQDGTAGTDGTSGQSASATPVGGGDMLIGPGAVVTLVHDTFTANWARGQNGGRPGTGGMGGYDTGGHEHAGGNAGNGGP